MNNLDKNYQLLLKDILENGTTKETRNGGTLSVFGRQIRHKMSEGFPLLTTKKMHWKSIVTELLWFLRGDTNIKYLVDNGCNIWNGDAYKRYCSNWKPVKEDCGEDLTPYTQEEFINKIKTDDEFVKKWGELGPIYGAQWREWAFMNDSADYRENWDWDSIDQIQNLINDLKTNPDSRRLMVNAWNVAELSQMTLPPCHYGFQVYTRELSWEERKETFQKHVDGILTEEWADKIGYPTRAISLMWNQRSCDVPLGIPFNIASYGLLLMMIADEVNMVPDELIGSLGDCHIYLNQIEGCREQIKREPKKLPTVHVRDGIESFGSDDIILENYQPHPVIKFPLSN